MSSFIRAARWLACLAATSMMAAPVVAAQPISNPVSKPAKQSVFDVRLDGKNFLQGQVVDGAGKANANAEIAIKSGAKQVATAKSDKAGRFMVKLPKSGVYQLAVADRSVNLRAWSADVAPPNAKQGVLCVTGQQAVRGQCGGCGGVSACSPGCSVGGCDGAGGYGRFGGAHGGARAFLTNPVVIGLGVAAAIAIPIALDDDDDDEPAS